MGKNSDRLGRVLECGHCGANITRKGYRICQGCGHATHAGCIEDCWNSG